MTSREAVDCAKRFVRRQARAAGKKIKLGHAGTLDPLATGVLVIAIGPATRLIPYVQNRSKTYTASFQLGVSSESLDLETALTRIPSCSRPSQSDIEKAIPDFIGDIEQVPPVYSAAKINGRRAYRLAREGREVQLDPRPIKIHKIDVLSYKYPNLKLAIECGTGTYIRSLGVDLAKQVGSSAVMTELCRDSIGGFALDRACSPDSLEDKCLDDLLTDPQVCLASLEKFELGASEQEQVRNGILIALPTESDECVATDNRGHLLAVMKRTSDGQYRPYLNFSGYWESRLSTTVSTDDLRN